MQSGNLLALTKGTTLNHYVVDDVLGQGGFGIVYRAHHSHLNETVVIKEFLPVELAGRSGDTVAPHSTGKSDIYDDCLRRFMSEGQTMVKLKHENVVRCRDLFKANGTAYLVMDFEDGFALNELINGMEEQNSRYSEDQLLHFLIPLANGLAYTHSQGVLHRDIKPANVFIRRSDSSPVILDFGAAKQNFAEASQSKAPFTEFYAPIEQISGDAGEKAQATIDIHAFGALVYRAITGTIGPKAEARVMAIATGKADPLPPASELSKDHYSADFLAIIDECLSFKADDRPQSMAAVVKRFKALPAAKGLYDEGTNSGSDDSSANFGLLDELILLAGADEMITEKEMSHLLSKATKLGIDQVTAQQYITKQVVEHGWQFKEAAQAESVKPVTKSKAKPKAQAENKPEPAKQPQKKAPEPDKQSSAESVESKAKNPMLIAVFIVIACVLGFIVIDEIQIRNEMAAQELARQEEQDKISSNKAKEEQHWKEASYIATKASYEKYLKQYPYGEYAADAKRALEKYSQFELIVHTTPSNAKVRILNINPKYYDRIKLDAGEYHIEVSAPGYQTKNRWLTITDSDYETRFTLEKNKVAVKKTKGCISGNCESGFGTYVYNSGNKYAGNWKDGYRNGRGTNTWTNGDVYDGDWKDGYRTGIGTYTWASDDWSGDRYIGDWLKNERTGTGTYIWPNGDKYVGDWKNGNRTGKGIIVWENGNKYSGDWIDDKRTGSGTFTWKDGDRYVGDFVDGVRTGMGTYIWPSGSKSTGQWRGNDRQGEHHYTYSDGSTETKYYIDDEEQ